MPRGPPLATRSTAPKSTDRLRGRHELSHEYHTNKWRQASERFRASAEGCYCRPCRARGVIVAAEITDHIVPVREAPERFWDETNWQGICRACHLAKLSEERTGKPARKRRGCGVDGLPLPGSGHWWCDDE